MRRPENAASKKPSGWIRSIGTSSPGSPRVRSTTQAALSLRKNARTTQVFNPAASDASS